MIKHYLRSAWRNLTRNAGFTIINMAGLTLGITAVLMIALFVWDEWQADTGIPGGEQVYRVCNETIRSEGTNIMVGTPPMYATVLKQDYPEVQQTLRIAKTPSKSLFEGNDKKIYEENGFMTDSSFFDVFPLPLKYGSYDKVFSDPTSVVISEKLAERYFGNNNPTGKQIMVNRSLKRITAVMKKNGDKFHVAIDYLLPMPYAYMPMDSWQWQQFHTYVRLVPGTGTALLQKKFAGFINASVNPRLQSSGFTYRPLFQPLRDIHLYSAGFKFDLPGKGNIMYVKALTIIGIFLLIIACCNFINLAAARSLKRAREVGVRKAAGAGRSQLVIQFLSETFIMTTVSMLLAVLAAAILLRPFNVFTDKHIAPALLFSPASLLLMLALIMGTTLMAGFYPAVLLSRFQPAKVLKGNFTGAAAAGSINWLRQGLVVTQFVLSGLLIICAITVYRQVNYLHHKDLGFDKEQLLFFTMRGDLMKQHYQDFKNELKRIPGVTNVALGYGFPGDAVAGDEILVPKEGGIQTMPATQLAVDEDYLKTLGLQLATGRDFFANSQADRDHAFIINETGVRELGFESPEKALSKDVYWHVWITNQKDSLKKGQIIGVVKDFHYKSLYDKVGTALIQLYPQAYSRVAIKMQTAGINNSIEGIRTAWKRYSPDYPLAYTFLDDNFAKMYTSEDKLKTLLFLFTGLAVFVGCLGLFGLAAFTAIRKTKEIGIRKVLGASVGNIIVLMSKEVIRLVLVSLCIAVPVAWFFTNKWLQDFPYRLPVSAWIYLFAGGIALTLALLTISFHAIKAATANPVKSLRIE